MTHTAFPLSPTFHVPRPTMGILSPVPCSVTYGIDAIVGSQTGGTGWITGTSRTLNSVSQV